MGNSKLILQNEMDKKKKKKIRQIRNNRNTEILETNKDSDFLLLKVKRIFSFHNDAALLVWYSYRRLQHILY